MTTIAWDGKTLAADTQVTDGGLRRTTRKIWCVSGADQDYLVGYTGDMDVGMAMRDWFCGKGDFPALQAGDKSPGSLLVIGEDLKIKVFERTATPIIFLDRQFAMGSGRDFALAAMRCGRSAADAVAIAVEFDCFSGGGVDVLDFAGG